MPTDTTTSIFFNFKELVILIGARSTFLIFIFLNNITGALDLA